MKGEGESYVAGSVLSQPSDKERKQGGGARGQRTSV